MGSATALNRLRQSLSNVTWRETLGKGRDFVVALNDQGSRIPFFCVHSLTGKATDYVPLAQRLGPDQPFFSPADSARLRRTTGFRRRGRAGHH